jgi:hypothetical protein
MIEVMITAVLTCNGCGEILSRKKFDLDYSPGLCRAVLMDDAKKAFRHLVVTDRDMVYCPECVREQARKVTAP